MYRILATLGGAVMAASAFAPWIAGPFGQTLIPWDLLRLMYEQTGFDMPIEPLLYFSTFVVAALLALLAIFGLAPRLLALLAGLYPVGLLGAAWVRGSDQLAQLGLPVPEGTGEGGPGIGAIWQQIGPIVGNGAWMYLGGMVALILAGLAGGRR